MPSVLLPLPSTDFDITEVVVPWNTFREAGYDVVFATPNGEMGRCDPLLLTGVIFGQLGAKPENVAHYRILEEQPGFRSPRSYDELDVGEHAAIILPGGHAQGMKSYLEDPRIHEAVVSFFKADKPVGAICHGGIVLARSIDPDTGKSVVHGRRLTALTKTLELTAWSITAWKLGNYYRTYPTTVQDELIEALGDAKLFEKGPLIASYANPFTVVDAKLVTARWPGDASKFAADLLALVKADQGNAE